MNRNENPPDHGEKIRLQGKEFLSDKIGQCIACVRSNLIEIICIGGVIVGFYIVFGVPIKEELDRQKSAVVDTMAP